MQAEFGTWQTGMNWAHHTRWRSCSTDDAHTLERRESGGFRWSHCPRLFLLAVMVIVASLETRLSSAYWFAAVAGVAVLALLGAFVAVAPAATGEVFTRLDTNSLVPAETGPDRRAWEGLLLVLRGLAGSVGRPRRRSRPARAGAKA